jgi:hypothetical protein
LGLEAPGSIAKSRIVTLPLIPRFFDLPGGMRAAGALRQ